MYSLPMKSNRASSLSSSGKTARAPAVLEFQACGRQWRISRPADLESLWAAIDDDIFNEDERLPYWVEVWPASLGMARWLTANAEAIRNRACLDLGCGLGFTALAASACGALVLAADYEREALSYARINASVNAVPSPLWVTMDWRHPAFARHGLERIWASDVLYEKRFAAPVSDFLDHCLAPDGVAWISDPGRNTFEHFRALHIRKGWTVRLAQKWDVEPVYTHTSPVGVNIWELRRA